MSKELVTLVREFDGRPVTTFLYRGRPAWVAREVGAALEYADDGKALVAMLTREWADEMKEGSDFVRVDGAELSDLKALLGVGVDGTPTPESESGPISYFSPSALVLFEPGLHLALLKTNKPAGKRLRRLLVDEVLPQLARDGRFDPARQVDDQGVLRGSSTPEAREARAARRLAYRQERETTRRAEIQAEAQSLEAREATQQEQLKTAQATMLDRQWRAHTMLVLADREPDLARARWLRDEAEKLLSQTTKIPAIPTIREVHDRLARTRLQQANRQNEGPLLPFAEPI